MRSFLAAAPAVVMLVAAGCGPATSAVSGAVTFDGQPLVSGTITFLPADGKGQPAGGAVKDGRYSIARVPPGPKVVQIDGAAATGPVTHEEQQREAESRKRKAASAAAHPVIPPNAVGNGAKVTVTAGSQTHDFALKSK